MKPSEKLRRVRERATALGIADADVRESTRAGKKYSACAGGRRRVHFGQAGAEDYWDHRDAERRRRYLARAMGIRDGNGKLTRNRRSSPNFWSIRLLWDGP